MQADPSKLFELLKASGWQTTALAMAGVLIVAASRYGIVPELPTWAVQITAVVTVICACLALGSIGNSILSALKEPLARWRSDRRQTQAKRVHTAAFVSSIPRMSSQEREIFAWLLHHNQSGFFGAADGGHAAVLIAQRFIVEATRPGRHMVDLEDFPYMVPDHIWDALQLHKADFPYTPERRGETRPHPWRRGFF